MILSQKHLEIDGKAVISHFTFSPPLVAASDLDNSACFIFPIQTKGNLYRADGKTEVSEKQGVLMKCGTYVNKWFGIGKNEVSEVVILRLYPDLMRNVIDPAIVTQLDQPVPSHNTNTVVQLDVLLKKYLDGLFFYFENPQLATEELVALKVKELTMLLINSKSSNPIIELLNSIFYRQRFALEEIVENNLYENVSLSEMAAIANMSVSTFKRKFKEMFNDTFSNYINHKRLEKASELLIRNVKASISEIAYEVGFNDPGYFTKSFKKKFKISPSAFRVSKLKQTILSWVDSSK